MIEVKNLTKRYGTNTALNNVSFTVEEGTIVGFLGPNGAGKSTTMNIITGYLSATSGPRLRPASATCRSCRRFTWI